MHGTPVARELGMNRKILVPPTPGILCALGMLVFRSAARSGRDPYRRIGGFPSRMPVKSSRRLREARARGTVLEDDQVPVDKQRIEVAVQVRYIGQSYELPIALSGWTMTTLARDCGCSSTMRTALGYGHADPAVPASRSSDLPSRRSDRSTATAADLCGRRGRAAGSCLGGVSEDIFRCSIRPRNPVGAMPKLSRVRKMLAGNRIEGPAAIDEVSATTILYPGDGATVRSDWKHPCGDLGMSRVPSIRSRSK